MSQLSGCVCRNAGGRNFCFRALAAGAADWEVLKLLSACLHLRVQPNPRYRGHLMSRKKEDETSSKRNTNANTGDARISGVGIKVRLTRAWRGWLLIRGFIAAKLARATRHPSGRSVGKSRRRRHESKIEKRRRVEGIFGDFFRAA